MLTVLVDRKAAQSLNSGLDTLNDQLLLRVERDSDYYVSVSATFRRSCYGMSLTELVRTLKPVATTELPTRIEKNRMSIGSGTEDRGFSDEWSVPSFEVRDADIGSPDLDLLEYEMNNRITGTEGKLSVPKELWRLVDALWAGNTPKTRDLFERKADASEVGAIRSSLDCGMELPVDCSVHALCEALVSFLGALPQPLLSPDLYPSVSLPCHAGHPGLPSLASAPCVMPHLSPLTPAPCSLSPNP
jgi:phosphatidylinositol-bisphosphatase